MTKAQKLGLAAVILVFSFWGIWAVGLIPFNFGGERPGEGRGIPTTVEIRKD
jgi:hypothetical protein